MDESTRGRNQETNRAIEELQERVRELEVRTGVVETTRPTNTQLVAAVFGGMTLGTSIATLLVLLLF